MENAGGGAPQPGLRRKYWTSKESGKEALLLSHLHHPSMPGASH